MNFQVQIHVSFTRIAEALRKLGGSLRKDSAEAIHEKIQQIKDLEIHLVERHASTFTSSSEGRGRLAEDVRKTYSHQRRIKDSVRIESSHGQPSQQEGCNPEAV